VFGIARGTQKISGKSGNISKKIFLCNFCAECDKNIFERQNSLKKIGPLYWKYRFLSHFLNKQQLEYTTVTELSFDTGNFTFYDQH